MVLPSSGQLSMGQIRTELGLSVANFSLDVAEDGGYVPINISSPSRPSAANPATISEWWGYNHTFVSDWGRNFGDSIGEARIMGIGYSQPVQRIAVLFRNTTPPGGGSTYGNRAYVATINAYGGLELVNEIGSVHSSPGTYYIPYQIATPGSPNISYTMTGWDHGTNCTWIPTTTEIYGHYKIYINGQSRTARFNTSTLYGNSWTDWHTFVNTSYDSNPAALYNDSATMFQAAHTSYAGVYYSYAMWPNNQYPGSGTAAMYAFTNWGGQPFRAMGLGTYAGATLWVTGYTHYPTINYGYYPIITNFFFGNGQPTMFYYISTHPYWIPVVTRQYGADIYVVFKYDAFVGTSNSFILAKFSPFGGTAAICQWARQIYPPDFYNGPSGAMGAIGLQADGNGVHFSAYVPNSSLLGRIDMYTFDHNGNTLTTRRLVSLTNYYSGVPYQAGGPLAIKDPNDSITWYIACDSNTNQGVGSTYNTATLHKHRTTVTGNFGNYIYGSVSPFIQGISMTLSSTSAGGSFIVTLGGQNVYSTSDAGYNNYGINYSSLY